MTVIARSDLSTVAQRGKAEAAKQSNFLYCKTDCFTEPVILHRPPRRFPIIEKARQAATDDTLGIRHDTVDQFLHGRNVLVKQASFASGR